jgi:hypothetical protein
MKPIADDGRQPFEPNTIWVNQTLPSGTAGPRAGEHLRQSQHGEDETRRINFDHSRLRSGRIRAPKDRRTARVGVGRDSWGTALEAKP